MTAEGHRVFHLGEILSVATGKMLSLRGMSGIYDILNYMTDDNLFTHQLPRASDECKPRILEQYPQFKDIVVPKFENKTDFVRWISIQTAIYGENLVVEPLLAHEKIDPIEELKQMCPEKVIHVIDKDNVDDFSNQIKEEAEEEE